MTRLFLSCLFVCFVGSLSAQTIGQYELRKRTSTGFTSYGVTLSNGQVLGQTAGVPAAITVTAAAGTLTGTTLASNVVSSSLTSAAGGTFGTAAFTATSAYEVPLTFSTGLTRSTNTITVNTSQNISTLSNLTTNGVVTTSGGTGALSITATSTGGFSTADAAKIPLFDSNGGLTSTFSLSVTRSGSTSGGVYLQAPDDVYAVIKAASGMGTTKTFFLGTTAGTLAITDNITKTAVGLGNVENTALSTWAGSSNLTTLGTVATGTWSGTAITIAKGGTGTTTANGALNALLPTQTSNSGKYLTTDGTNASWATVTVGVTSITGTANEITVTGTTTPTLSLPSALTFTGKTITGGTFSSPTLTTPALGTPSAIVLTNATGSPTGISFTKAQLNTIVSDDDPAYLGTTNTFSAAQTINTTGAGIPLNLTMSSTSAFKVTSNAAANVRVDLGVRGAYISTQSDYNTEFSGYFGGIASQNSAGINFTSGNWALSNAADCISYREAANHWAHRNNTSAQRLSVANTYTSSTNNEFGVLDWQTTANILRIGSEVGSGGGTARNVILVRGGATKETIGANTTDDAQPRKLPSYIVSGLPSASTCGAGSCAFVTDATVTVTYTTVVGGGSNKVLVISDGSNWIIH